MSPISSRAAIRFVIALFLAQTFVNAVAVPHPHIHKVTDARQVVSLSFVERQEPEAESKNVFDAIVDTLKSYNGWQIFQDFFRKLFNGSPPSPEDNDNDDEPTIIVVPTPGASETPVDVVSVIESFFSEIASITEPVVVIPTDAPEASATEDPIMSILPIFPITTAIELFPTEEPSLPSELISDLPETTEIPIVVVVPPFEANSTDVVVLPTGILTAPIVTAPIVTGPVEVAPIATDAPFPIANGTLVAPLPGTDVPVVVIIPTGIVSPVDTNVSASAVINATVSLTSTVALTVTVDPTLIGTGVASVGTGLPVTFTEEPLFPNVTAITPTLILATGTGASVGTIIPTIAVSPLYPNSTSDAATAVAPIGTVIVGTGVQIGTGVSFTPVETVVIGTGIVGTGTGAAVAPVDTALPLFPNTTTAVEIVVEPTFVLGTGTAPAVGTISAAPVASEASDAIWANTTTTTVTNVITPSAIIGTGVDSALATGGSIVLDLSDALFPNATASATADATLTIEVPIVTDLPLETVTAPLPIIEPIPSDAPVVEFPGQPLLPILPTPEVPSILPLPIIPVVSVAPVEEPTPLPIVPIVPVATVEASAEASAGATVIPVVPVAPAEDPTPAILPLPILPTAPEDVPTIPVVPVAPIAPTLPVAPVAPAIQPALFPIIPPQ